MGLDFSSIDILFCCSHACCLEETQRLSAKSQLYKLCSVRHWNAPIYEFIAEGPCHMILYEDITSALSFTLFRL